MAFRNTYTESCRYSHAKRSYPQVPQACTGVPSTVLDPQTAWEDACIYKKHLLNLADMFVKNFATFQDQVGAKEALAHHLFS